MKLIMLGPPGAGKGTQAQLLNEKLGVPHISTGELLRRAVSQDTELGRISKKYMDSGKLVPDEIIMELMGKRISEQDCKGGYILDGFPRTIGQAEALEKIDDIDWVLNIVIDEEVIVKRLESRRTCSKCKAIYNLVGKPPRVEGTCDICGSSLYQRDDDNEKTVRMRLLTYTKETEPLIEYYTKRNILKNVQSGSDIQETFKRMLTTLGCE